MAFLQTMLILSCSLRLLLYQRFGYLDQFSWVQGLIVSVPLFGAMLLGHKVMDRVKTPQMRQIVFGFIGLAGVYYLFKF